MVLVVWCWWWCWWYVVGGVVLVVWGWWYGAEGDVRMAVVVALAMMGPVRSILGHHALIPPKVR
eukprot:3834168-Lingulodinium_polyedra.AAC.1